MKFAHTMIRIGNLEGSLRFYKDGLGLAEVGRWSVREAGFTIVMVSAPGDEGGVIALNHTEGYEIAPQDEGNFVHIAFYVDDLYAICRRILDERFTLARPPRDGRVAVVRSPDHVDFELIQRGRVLDVQEPWRSMSDNGNYEQLNTSIAARIRLENAKKSGSP